ncbi:MAG TPA: hypothetical protein HA252_00800 [Candidatus Diapherotrites archaeon]|uniref:Uncharacterized protein n=1 Tax=Candidatus Iainarchaeum sp. TaxID=3101447 RepID=A0A7J4JJ16_9ARCH|nr:hypothetical protein [Candidatus Diapherotrites archaeon]
MAALGAGWLGWHSWGRAPTPPGPGRQPAVGTVQPPKPTRPETRQPRTRAPQPGEAKPEEERRPKPKPEAEPLNAKKALETLGGRLGEINRQWRNKEISLQQRLDSMRQLRRETIIPLVEHLRSTGELEAWKSELSTSVGRFQLDEATGNKARELEAYRRYFSSPDVWALHLTDESIANKVYVDHYRELEALRVLEKGWREAATERTRWLLTELDYIKNNPSVLLDPLKGPKYTGLLSYVTGAVGEQRVDDAEKLRKPLVNEVHLGMREVIMELGNDPAVKERMVRDEVFGSNFGKTLGRLKDLSGQGGDTTNWLVEMTAFLEELEKTRPGARTAINDRVSEIVVAEVERYKLLLANSVENTVTGYFYQQLPSHGR